MLPHSFKHVFSLALGLLVPVIAFDAYGYVDRILPPEFLERTAKNDAVQGTCIQASLDFCQGQFAKALGSDPTIFKQPVLFVALLSKLYKKPVNQGFLGLCNARNDFVQCLGSSYYVCTDLFNILGQQNYSRENAFMLAGIYNDIDFDCASGFTEAVTNFDCIAYVHNSKTYQTKSKDCFDTYNNTVEKDSSTFCTASEAYSLCLADIYNDPSVNTCDFKEIMWWECERAIRRSKLDGYCNTITCQKIFEPSTKSEFTSLIDQVAKGGLISQARHRLFKMTAALYKRRQHRHL